MADKTIIDPLHRKVTLHDHTWFGHVLVNHPEMRRHRALVERTLSSPSEIRISPSDPNCRLYFEPGPRNGIMTVVVADVVRGFVKTAHIVGGPKGALEWSKPTP